MSESSVRDTSANAVRDTGANARWPQDVNLAEYLISRHVAEGRGDRCALLYDDTELSYFDVAAQVARQVAFLRKWGIRAGDRVVLVLPDTPIFVSTFFAALHLGVIAVPLSPSMPCEDVASIALRVEAKIAFVHEDFAEKFKGLERTNIPVVIGDDFAVGAEPDIDRFDDVPDAAYRCAGAVAYCLFSSGTTGVPKGIPHSHTDILECILPYSIDVLGMSSMERVLAVPKLSFGYGLGGNLLSAFFVGGTSILFSEPSRGASIAAAAERYSPTLFLGQPRVIVELLESDPPESLRRLRVAVSAGEVLTANLYQRWRDQVGVELLDGFGSTEVGHVFITNRLGDVRPGCAGRPVKGFDVEVRDESGALAKPDTAGRMWVRGPSLTTGYWEDPERTSKSFIDGWVFTGDLARLDQFGYITVCGRADDMIKAGCGEWVSPIEIENELQQDAAVAESAVVGFTDEFGVVRPKAYVVLRDGERPSRDIEQRLTELVARRWPDQPHKHLGAIEFATSLPRGSTGKLQRFRLQPSTLSEFSYQC